MTFLCTNLKVFFWDQTTIYDLAFSPLCHNPVGGIDDGCSFILSLMFIICIWTESSSVLQDRTTLKLFKNRNKSPSHRAKLNYVLNWELRDLWTHLALLPHFAFRPEMK